MSSGRLVLLVLLGGVLLPGCKGKTTGAGTPDADAGSDQGADGGATDGGTTDGGATDGGAASTLADVLAVSASGEAGAYQFDVTVQSPDVDCTQYAQWWEVVDTTGSTLHYRRILQHSHADEQPFTRGGGPVPVAADQSVVVRAWMLPGGYGGRAMQGSVAGGFTQADLPADFGADLATVDPQVDDCLY